MHTVILTETAGNILYDNKENSRNVAYCYSFAHFLARIRILTV